MGFLQLIFHHMIFNVLISPKIFICPILSKVLIVIPNSTVLAYFLSPLVVVSVRYVPFPVSRQSAMSLTARGRCLKQRDCKFKNVN